MTWQEIRELVADIEFRNWRFEVVEGPVYSPHYLRVLFDTTDTSDGSPVVVGGRKWQLSQHMTRSEIVYTALKAVLTAIEHEAREQFLYRGRAIFGPHIDVEALHRVAEDVDVRLPVRVAEGVVRQGVRRS